MREKLYYTEDELDKDINTFIKESEDELVCELKELNNSELTPEILKAFEECKNVSRSDLINL